MNKNNNKNLKNGFTLIELLIVMSIFSVIVGGIAGVLISTIKAQRYALSSQHLIDQGSYAMEYMSRALRMAKKAPENICGLTQGQNYKAIGDDHPFGGGITAYEGVGFISVEDNSIKCRNFYFNKAENALWHESGALDLPLTSSRVIVDKFLVYIVDSEDNQPYLVVYLEMSGVGIAGPPTIKLQTTISQRDLNVGI